MIIDIRGTSIILADDEMVEELLDLAEGETINNSHARSLASLYQSPGSIGSAFAELASTGKVNARELITDIELTFWSDPENPDGDRLLRWAEWAIDQQHADYPHEPGMLPGCEACDLLGGELDEDA